MKADSLLEQTLAAAGLFALTAALVLGFATPAFAMDDCNGYQGCDVNPDGKSCARCALADCGCIGPDLDPLSLDVYCTCTP